MNARKRLALIYINNLISIICSKLCYNKKRFKSNLSNQQWKYFEISRDSISFSNLVLKNNFTFGEVLTLDFNLAGDGEITFDATCNCYERAVADFSPAQLELTSS